LLESGRFLTVAPGYLVRLRRHPALKILPIQFPSIRHEVAVFTLKGRSLSPLARLFIERVRAFAAPLAKGG
jgi:DNA-binding transcriptional LysR family regulator